MAKEDVSVVWIEFLKLFQSHTLDSSLPAMGLLPTNTLVHSASTVFAHECHLPKNWAPCMVHISVAPPPYYRGTQLGCEWTPLSDLPWGVEVRSLPVCNPTCKHHIQQMHGLALVIYPLFKIYFILIVTKMQKQFLKAKFIW